MNDAKVFSTAVSAFTVVGIDYSMTGIGPIYRLETAHVYDQDSIFDWMVDNPGRELEGFFNQFPGGVEDKLFLGGVAFAERKFKVVELATKRYPNYVYVDNICDPIGIQRRRLVSSTTTVELSVIIN